jgi:hypothetical protein
MTRRLKYFIIATTVGLLLALAVFICTARFGGHLIESYMCGNEVNSRTTSPDGAYTATVYTRTCGITTAPSMQVALDVAGDALDGEDDRIASTFGTEPIRAYWANARKLIVACDVSDLNSYTGRKSWRDVQIVYVGR